MQQSRTVSFIFILCDIVMYKCSVSCTKSNKGLSPDSIKFNHLDEWNDKDFVYEVNSSKQLRRTDFRNNSKELPGEYGVARKTSGSHQLFRVGDAHQVANYSRNGGPGKDNSHFFRDQNFGSTDKNNMLGESNPIKKDNTGPTVDKTGSDIDYNPIIKTPNVPVSHMPEDPYMPVLNSLLGVPRNLLYPVLNTLTGQPQSSGDSLLGAPLRQTLRNQIDKFRELPIHLMKAASSPFADVLHTKPPKVKKRGKSKIQRKRNRKYPKKLRGRSTSTLKLSKSKLNMIFREPIGYIIRYILHDEHEQPVSPVVDSLQKGPSDTVFQNTNIEQYVVSPAHSYHYTPPNEDVKPTEEQQIIYCLVQ